MRKYKSKFDTNTAGTKKCINLDSKWSQYLNLDVKIHEVTDFKAEQDTDYRTEQFFCKKRNPSFPLTTVNSPQGGNL